MHIIIKILEEYKNQPKSLLRLLLAMKRNKLGLKGAAEALRSKDDLLNTKKELDAIKLQTGQKMIVYASLELKSLMLGLGYPRALFVMVHVTIIPTCQTKWHKVITADYLPSSLLFG